MWDVTVSKSALFSLWATSWENLFMPYGNNKGTDQPGHLRSLISTFAVHCLDRIIPILVQSIWAAARQNQQNELCAQQRHRSDKHLLTLIWVFAVRMKKHWFLNYLLSAQQRLIRLGGCPGWSESSLGEHVVLLVLSCGGLFKDCSWAVQCEPHLKKTCFSGFLTR